MATSARLRPIRLESLMGERIVGHACKPFGVRESVEKVPRTYFEELLIKQGDKKRRI
jgi:hypothetical protein